MAGVLCRALVIAVCCALTAAGESRRQSRMDRHTHVLRLGVINLGCAVLTNEEANRFDRFSDASDLAQRISNRRTGSPTPPRILRSRQPPSDDGQCPNGVTYFDGCNSCSCGADKLCTLKACNAETTVDIFDPCRSITCGYHQRCQAICVGQLCRLKPSCISDDAVTCHNCPWICVNERLHCSDSVGSGACKPTLACYKPAGV